MPPTKLIRRPAWAALPSFSFPGDAGLIRNRLRNLFDEPLFRLPDEPITDEMLPEKIVAEMTDGVLKVTVPKAPEAKAAAQKIEIKMK